MKCTVHDITYAKHDLQLPRLVGYHNGSLCRRSADVNWFLKSFLLHNLESKDISMNGQGLENGLSWFKCMPFIKLSPVFSSSFINYHDKAYKFLRTTRFQVATSSGINRHIRP